MKTAIIGLPMVGKTSLFTILTGVHEAARVGLMEARVGVTKVPDATAGRAGEDLRSAQNHARHRGVSGFSRHLERSPARSQLSRQHARGGCAGARAAAFSKRHRAARKRLGGSDARSRRRGDGADPERPGGGGKAHGAAGEGSQEDQELRSWTGNLRCWSAARRRSSRTSRCERWSFPPTKRS